MPTFELISTILCPHAQRAAILLAEKRVSYQRTYIELSGPPSWFKTVSPLGRVPLLRVDGRPIFEIGAICSYIEEATESKLLPDDPFTRASHRMWAEFANAVIADIFGLYSAPDIAGFEQKRQEIRQKLDWFATALGEGPYFAGASFSLPDAAFAPVLRLIDLIESSSSLSILEPACRIADYRNAVRDRQSVREAVVADYAERFCRYLASRGSHLSRSVMPERRADPI